MTLQMPCQVSQTLTLNKTTKNPLVCGSAECQEKFKNYKHFETDIIKKHRMTRYEDCIENKCCTCNSPIPLHWWKVPLPHEKKRSIPWKTGTQHALPTCEDCRDEIRINDRFKREQCLNCSIKLNESNNDNAKRTYVIRNKRYVIGSSVMSRNSIFNPFRKSHFNKKKHYY